LKKKSCPVILRFKAGWDYFSYFIIALPESSYTSLKCRKIRIVTFLEKTIIIVVGIVLLRFGIQALDSYAGARELDNKYTVNYVVNSRWRNRCRRDGIFYCAVINNRRWSRRRAAILLTLRDISEIQHHTCPRNQLDNTRQHRVNSHQPATQHTSGPELPSCTAAGCSPEKIRRNGVALTWVCARQIDYIFLSRLLLPGKLVLALFRFKCFQQYDVRAHDIKCRGRA